MTRPQLIKLAIVAAPGVIFLGLLYNYLGLSGTRTVHYVVGDSSPFIQSLLPDDRVGQVQHGSVKLLDQPVYFSVFAPPGGWQTADVKISFNTGSHALLELGVLKDLFAQAYDFRPLANTVVENLETNGWLGKPNAQLGPNVNVFLRQELVTSTPAHITGGEIAVYRVALPWSPPTGETTAGKDHTYALGLQGPHELFTAIGEKEALKLTVRVTDLNQTVGADGGAIRVYSETGEMVAEQAFPDDGSATGDGSLGPSQTVVVAPDGLPAGVYRLVLSAASDVVFDEFVTKQNYLMVKNSITLAQHTGLLLLNTSAKKITVEPLAAESLGTVTFGSTPMVLDEVHRKVSGTSTDRKVSPIILPAGGVKITGEGFFALGTSMFFSPEPAGFTSFVTAPQSFKAIAAYFPPQLKEGDWRVASSSFELNTLVKERGAYKFVLSAPLVKELDGGVEVHGIDITFRKPPLTLRSLLSSLKGFVKDLIW